MNEDDLTILRFQLYKRETIDMLFTIQGPLLLKIHVKTRIVHEGFFF